MVKTQQAYRAHVILCSVCQSRFIIKPDFSFVVLRIACPKCDATILFTHPRYVEMNLTKFTRCLDCGDPIPRTKVGNRFGRTFFLTHTCPKCWRNHRNDEPGAEVLSIADLHPRVSSIS